VEQWQNEIAMINERTVKKAKSLHKKGIPILVIKYSISAFSMANNVYELLWIKNGKMECLPLERIDAVTIIKTLSLPMLHKVDNRNVIWGDENFKAEYQLIKE
jgi:hypothetical protein